MKKTGTHEWAKETRNIQIGCEHNCRYCYARHMAVYRFNRCTAEQWLEPVIDQKKVDKGYRKKVEGGIMFPSTHDITKRNLSEYLCVLHKLLDAGNNVLIVTKPHLGCIEAICESCAFQKDQIKFRFTIGSSDQRVLSFWEPNAPGIAERLNCLQYAYSEGYKTSVSCEPLLEPWSVMPLIETLQVAVTETIWIGTANKLIQRTKWKLNRNHPEIRKLLEWQSIRHMREIRFLLCDNPKVRWKDSYVEPLNRKDRSDDE